MGVLFIPKDKPLHDPAVKAELRNMEVLSMKIKGKDLVITYRRKP